MTSVSSDRRQGLNSSAAIKVPCRVATTANITLSGLQTIDGVALAADDRVLVKDQTTTSENGIYVADTGTWQRDLDFDGAYDARTGTLVMVLEGTANANTYWRLSTSGTVVFGSSNITFAQALFGDASTLNFLQSGTGAVIRSAQAKMRDIVSIEDFGAASGASAAANTAAIVLCLAALSAAGGGIAFVPNKIYDITELSFLNYSNVVIEGLSQGYASGIGGKSASLLRATAGVYAIRLTNTSTQCGLRNLGVASNGVQSFVTTGPIACPITTAGVEYGVLIENGGTTMEAVTVNNFQYGCVIANNGNTNLFDRCAFNNNTKVGFAVTPGTIAGYALYHPNLTRPDNLVPAGALQQTTIYTMRNCNFGENAWGMILRDGAGNYHSTKIESQAFGGIMMYVGTSDSSVGGTFYDTYFEDNWIGFSLSATYTVGDGTANALTGHNLLLDSAATPMTWTVSASNDATFPGHQLYMMSIATGTSAGPIGVTFHRTSFTMSGNQKAMFLRSALRPRFFRGSTSGGDSANEVRLGANYGGDGYYCNVAQFEDFQGTKPVNANASGNRTMWMDYEAAADFGGVTAVGGKFRGLAGTVYGWGTPPYRLHLTTSGYAIDLSVVQSVIFETTGTASLGLPATTSSSGAWVFVKTRAARAVVSWPTGNDVIASTGGAAQTNILPASPGAWAILQAGSTAWEIVAQGST